MNWALSSAGKRLEVPERPENLTPLAFARDILGHDVWETPAAVMAAIDRPMARVAVKACHASSKTFTAAEIMLWWVHTGGIAISTAPTWEQVKRLLWGELHKAYASAKRPLGGELNQVEWRIAPDNYAIGLSTNEGVRFQGFHGHVLLVLDEAPGVRPDIYEAIDGIRAGGDVRQLLLGNPTIGSGPFYDAFTANRAGWATFTIDAFDTPNLAGLTLDDLLDLSEDDLDRNPRPYLVTRRWVKERYLEWGETSPLWQSRVRGAFPDQAEDALISLAWLEASRERDLSITSQGQVVDSTAGIDVAGPGEDETAVCVRAGGQILGIRSWHRPDPRGEVLAYLREFPALRRVNVDSAGIGWNFYLHLRDQLGGVDVRPVNVGESPRDKEKYANLKAELYWGLRQRFQTGEIGGLRDDMTISQLAGIRYEHNARGQVVIESKEDAAKRGVKSPDRAECAMLAFAEPPTFLLGFV